MYFVKYTPLPFLYYNTSMKETHLIAIDPGYDRCGVAIFSLNGTLLHSTCIETKKNDTYTTRLRVVGDAFLKEILQWQPKILAIETLFFSLNKKTALKVAEARGIILYLAEVHNLTIVEISPQTIKTSITGVGNASKDQVLRMTSMIMKNSFTGKQDDEIDAIAIGLTAVQLHKTKQLFPIA